ncbi:HAD family hydrolase [Nocardiopsis valliformis]|uniref:HAD family hydrolase n=1 Tax=Nocardiopsis valliformis TaxID=239974 RepID=UPI000364822C|nr:HAD-IA family hydrolase [Nocardiopsis valliformis]
MSPEQASLMRGAAAFLLDFDGPVCSAFAGYPALEVARDLLDDGVKAGTPATPEMKAETDPMKVLELLYEAGPKNHGRAESFLTSAEVRSVQQAAPTSGAVEFLEAAREFDTPVAVVSNNSPEAVQAFLENQKLDGLVVSVVGRDKTSPHLMKPNPYLLKKALRDLSVSPAQALMIGDSVTDIEVSQSVGVASVGYANRPGKAQRFSELGADIVVTDMAVLARVLLSPPHPG